MKAIYLSTYGDPEKVLSLREMEMPQPTNNQVLVKVMASAINDYDWAVVMGKPFAYRLMFGISKPRKKYQFPGMELAGVVEAVGPDVSRLKPGDEVYGDTSEYGFGTLAEYLCIDEKALSLKPGHLSFVEAASLPHASMLALQGLRQLGNLREGQQLLINGGGGGVGTLALQLALPKGVVLTGVDTGEKLQMMQELGFHEVLDYQELDFTRTGQRYDYILDCKTNRSPMAYLRSLKSEGKYVTVGGRSGKLIQLLLAKPFLKLGSKKKLQILALKANLDLEYISELFKNNQLQCVIDGPYPLEETAKAIKRFGEGKHSGKVIISLNQPTNGESS